ncbi:MAG: superoxide dismutase [Bdellovibrionales bacterium]
MPFELSALPFDAKALEPHMSARTFEFHHGKHHKAYVDTLNALVAGTALEKESLETIIKKTSGDEQNVKVFNNAAQVWNHTFFWNSMKPQGGGKPSGVLAQKIDEAFGSLDGFKAKFKEAALGQFGSGWVWLVLNGGKLEIVKTPNAMTPLASGGKALLTCDVWEHAYYLDYQNRRADMVQAFLDYLVNWEFAAQNLS